MLPEGHRDGVEHIARLFENHCTSKVFSATDEILRFTQDDERQHGLACVNIAWLLSYPKE